MLKDIKIKKINNIKFRTTRSPEVKASIVERFNRTLKSKMWRSFTFAYTKRYINILQDIARGYNKSIHSSIKIALAPVTLKLVWLQKIFIRNLNQ